MSSQKQIRRLYRDLPQPPQSGGALFLRHDTSRYALVIIDLNWKNRLKTVMFRLKMNMLLILKNIGF